MKVTEVLFYSCLCVIFFLVFAISSTFLFKKNQYSKETYRMEENVSTGMMSDFGSQEYECTGSCSCVTIVVGNRRSISSIARGISGLFVASTSILAYYVAKEHFETECQNNFSLYCDPSDSIISTIDECNISLEGITDNGDNEKNKKQDIKSLFELLRYCVQAKHLKRKGWVVMGVKEPETITGHMHCMSLMSMVIPLDANVDRTKILKMCVIHDLGESIIGDFTPVDDITEEEKHKLEEEAVKKLTSLVYYNKKQNDNKIGEIYDLWIEFEKGETIESKYARDLDKFDLLLQAFEYEKSDDVDLESFFEMHKDLLQTPELKECMSELLDERSNYFIEEKEKKKLVDFDDEEEEE